MYLHFDHQLQSNLEITEHVFAQLQQQPQ